MKLIRVGPPGDEQPGVLLADESRVDATAFGEDYDEKFFASDGTSRHAVLRFGRSGRRGERFEIGGQRFVGLGHYRPGAIDQYEVQPGDETGAKQELGRQWQGAAGED